MTYITEKGPIVLYKEFLKKIEKDKKKDRKVEKRQKIVTVMVWVLTL